MKVGISVYNQTFNEHRPYMHKQMLIYLFRMTLKADVVWGREEFLNTGHLVRSHGKEASPQLLSLKLIPVKPLMMVIINNML